MQSIPTVSVSKDLDLKTDLADCVFVAALACRIAPIHTRCFLPPKTLVPNPKMVMANWTVRATCALLLCLGCVMQAATSDDVTGEDWAAGSVLY
jgi:hypothetical protein